MLALILASTLMAIDPTPDIEVIKTEIAAASAHGDFLAPSPITRRDEAKVLTYMLDSAETMYARGIKTAFRSSMMFFIGNVQNMLTNHHLTPSVGALWIAQGQAIQALPIAVEENELVELGGTAAAALTPLDDIAALKADIAVGLANGDIFPTAAALLTNTLTAAKNRINQGNKAAAINLLQSFIQYVQAFVKTGYMNSVTGASLIAKANAIIAELTAGP